ncbi:hypothetical protein GCM10025734_11220 [Kitasatospora paranensis]
MEDTAVEGDVLGVVAVEVEVLAELRAVQGGGEDGARPGEPDDGVVGDLAVGPADDDPSLPEPVVPLVVGEVVEAVQVVPEVERGQDGGRRTGRVVARPAVAVQRVDQGCGVAAGADGDRAEAHAQEAAHHGHRVVAVGGGHLDGGGPPDRALGDQGAARRVTRHQEVLLGDLDGPAIADPCPQGAQAVEIGGRGCLGQDFRPQLDEPDDHLGIGRPRHRADHEVRLRRADEIVGRQVRRRAPPAAGLLRRLRTPAGDTDERQPLRQQGGEAGEELGPPAGADDAERGGLCHAILRLPPARSVRPVVVFVRSLSSSGTVLVQAPPSFGHCRRSVPWRGEYDNCAAPLTSEPRSSVRAEGTQAPFGGSFSTGAGCDDSDRRSASAQDERGWA